MKRVLTPLILALALAAPALAETDVVTLIDRGYLREAERLLVARVAADPADALSLSRLARIRVEQNRFDEAQKLAERAVAAAPGLFDAHYALSEVCGAKAQGAGVLKAPGLARRFKKEIDAALAIDPKNADALQSLIEFHRQAPGIVGGDKKKMPGLLDQLTAADPVEGWRERARLAMRDRDSTRAEASLRKAIELETQGAGARMELARWLAPAWRKPAEAEQLALAALEREPWRQDAWALLASLQAQAGRLEDLDQTLARAEAADPTRLGAHYTAGRQLLIDNRDLARAERCFQRYISREPEIGWPGLGGAHWRLGQIQEKRGDKAAAISEMETALRLQPELEDAKKDLKRLKG